MQRALQLVCRQLICPGSVLETLEREGNMFVSNTLARLVSCLACSRFYSWVLCEPIVSFLFFAFQLMLQQLQNQYRLGQLSQIKLQQQQQSRPASAGSLNQDGVPIQNSALNVSNYSQNQSNSTVIKQFPQQVIIFQKTWNYYVTLGWGWAFEKLYVWMKWEKDTRIHQGMFSNFLLLYLSAIWSQCRINPVTRLGRVSRGVQLPGAQIWKKQKKCV